jgi:hypothetical protein
MVNSQDKHTEEACCFAMLPSTVLRKLDISCLARCEGVAGDFLLMAAAQSCVRDLLDHGPADHP